MLFPEDFQHITKETANLRVHTTARTLILRLSSQVYNNCTLKNIKKDRGTRLHLKIFNIYNIPHDLGP